ncbi:MAG TPA: thioredoxin family protein, partial [Adhaeribacter sp.]|nr:thioredoxin family protein [Adhaeribacter sp.]
NDSVADFYNANFVAYKVDMEKGEGPELGKRYEVNAYPNFLFLAPDGELLHRTTGARPVQAFIKEGKEALNPEKRFSYYQKKYEAGNREPAFLAQYVLLKADAALDNSKEFKDYLATQTDKELLNRQNWTFIQVSTQYTGQPGFQRFIKNYNQFANAYPKDSVDLFLLRTYQNDFMMAVMQGDVASETRLKTELAGLKIKDSERLLWEVDAIGYERKGDLKNYSKTITRLVEKYYTASPVMLNNYAWAFYEKVDDKKMLAKAETWITQAVSLEPEYAFLDTQAAVLYKLGKKKEARAAAENAIAMGKKSGEDVADTEALLQKINALK